MKDKLLKLIYAELAHVTGAKKFYADSYDCFDDGKPTYQSKVKLNSKDDSGEKTINQVYFKLKFADKPDVEVTTRITVTPKDVVKGYLGRFFKKVPKHFRPESDYWYHEFEYSVISTIYFDEFSFDLTDEEREQLYEAAKFSNIKNEELRKQNLEIALNKKIDERLKRYDNHEC